MAPLDLVRRMKATEPEHYAGLVRMHLSFMLDLATADKESLERVVKANYGSADHEVAIVIQNAGTIGQNGRKITVSTKKLCLIRIQITVLQRLLDYRSLQTLRR